MKKTANNNERRVINIPKDKFEKFQRFCFVRGLSMPRWMVILADMEINRIESIHDKETN